ncbi:phage major capsid protein [Nocardia terpenica]|uniref:Phage major capsid protein n=1 Tax=Nocardia terpenica TaxID=455432 RepID=A0A291RLG4_9NOCA|nr:phage major capsid protein [Nocardia terpenica]ATL68138.1 phage major capsid protein [Nocardia terpenica]
MPKVRIGPAYTDPNLLAMHPGTFSMLRRQKDTYGRYLLEAAADVANTTWGKRVVTNTKIPAGKVIVANSDYIMGWTRMGMIIEMNQYADSNWTTNTVSFRAEERIAYGIMRPSR